MNTQLNMLRLTDTGNKLIVARWEGFGEMGDKGEGIKKYKLVLTKQSQGCKVGIREYSL